MHIYYSAVRGSYLLVPSLKADDRMIMLFTSSGALISSQALSVKHDYFRCDPGVLVLIHQIKNIGNVPDGNKDRVTLV